MLSAPQPPTQTIISPDLARAYDEQYAIVEASHGEASHHLSRYWWALWQIKSRNLWRAKFEALGPDGRRGFKEWLGELCKEPFGPSKTDFYEMMGAIERFKRLGKTDAEIQAVLGRLGTALKQDLKELFAKSGKGNMLPEAVAAIETGGETVSEWIDRVAALSPSEARSEVTNLLNNERIYFQDDDALYDSVNGRILANVIWESKEDGIIYTGTVVVTATETTDGPHQTRKPNYLPESVANYILKRWGLFR